MDTLKEQVKIYDAILSWLLNRPSPVTLESLHELEAETETENPSKGGGQCIRMLIITNDKEAEK